MELLISLAFGAAVAGAAFLIGTYFVRSDRSVETSHDHVEEEAPPAPPPLIVEPSPARPIPDRPQPHEAAASHLKTTSPEPRPPIGGVWKPARPRTLPAPVIATAIPKRIAFLDVETTGLTDKDRIVTLAGVKLLDTDLLATGPVSVAYLHLIFDPGRKSHARAEAVHGYSDWVLRQQDDFGVYAETIEKFFNSADLVVAHNAEFDLGFYNREMERAARQPIAIPGFCTMNTYRQRGFAGSCSLDAVCQKIGAARNGELHGALEDAWLAMRVYLWLNQRNFSGELPTEFTNGPSNFKPAPPLPPGPLPRRRRKTAAVVASHSLN